MDLEQQKIEDFSGPYFQGRTVGLKDKITKELNNALGSFMAPDLVKQSLKDRFADKGKKFSFSRKEDRVQLGYGMVDLLYNERFEY